MPNNDGFEPGQLLTFAQIARVARSKREANMGPALDDIDGMGKAHVRELLEAHGVEVATGAKVGDMRATLKRVMFVGDE